MKPHELHAQSAVFSHAARAVVLLQRAAAQKSSAMVSLRPS